MQKKTKKNKQQLPNHQIAEDSDFARFRKRFKWKKVNLNSTTNSPGHLYLFYHSPSLAA